MSTLWTPGGEHPVGPPGREQPSRSGQAQTGPSPSGAGASGTQPSPEDEAAQLQQLQEQLARAPVEMVVANHAFGLFELAALHLSCQPPQLDQARLAIDALAALVEGLAGRLGDHEQQLNDGLGQLRLAFVQIRGAQQSNGGQPGDEGEDAS